MKLLLITQKVSQADSNLGFFCGWIKAFADQFSEVVVLANEVGVYNLPPNVRVLSMGKENGLGRLKRYLNFYRYLFSNINTVDAVFVHMIPAWVTMSWPVAFLYRKNLYLWYMHRSVTVSLWLANLLVKKIFTASKESFRLKSNKVIITGHGIDIEIFKFKKHFPEKGTIKALTIGRISASKDLIFLINVVYNIISSLKTNISFDIFGLPITDDDIRYKKEVEKLIKDRNLSDVIRFKGAIVHNDLPSVYWSHDVFLHVGANGSLDKVVLEAMASGTKVVSCSEAFEKILPVSWVAKYDIGDFSNKVLNLSTDDELLNSVSDYVTKEHGLESLSKKVFNNIKND